MSTTKKITVEVPDWLYDAIIDVKHLIDLSVVFTDAVRLRVKALKDAQDTAETYGLNRASTITRLRKERAELNQQAITTGRDVGVTWATGASYLDLVAVVKLQKEHEDCTPAKINENPRFGKYFTNNMPQDDTTPAWFIGWMSGAVATATTMLKMVDDADDVNNGGER